jgi:hypothetical protein
MDALKTLKQLFDEGFIDTQEFEERKRQIIDNLTRTSLPTTNQNSTANEPNPRAKRVIAQASAQLHQRRWPLEGKIMSPTHNNPTTVGTATSPKLTSELDLPRILPLDFPPPTTFDDSCSPTPSTQVMATTTMPILPLVTLGKPEGSTGPEGEQERQDHMSTSLSDSWMKPFTMSLSLFSSTLPFPPLSPATQSQELDSCCAGMTIEPTTPTVPIQLDPAVMASSQGPEQHPFSSMLVQGQEMIRYDKVGFADSTSCNHCLAKLEQNVIESGNNNIINTEVADPATVSPQEEAQFLMPFVPAKKFETPIQMSNNQNSESTENQNNSRNDSYGMSLDEKYTLSQKISQLPGPALRTVIDIVRQTSPRCLRMSGEDWTFDLETLAGPTLWRLNSFVDAQLTSQRVKGEDEDGPAVSPQDDLAAAAIVTDGESDEGDEVDDGDANYSDRGKEDPDSDYKADEDDDGEDADDLEVDIDGHYYDEVKNNKRSTKKRKRPNVNVNGNENGNLAKGGGGGSKRMKGKRKIDEDLNSSSHRQDKKKRVRTTSASTSSPALASTSISKVAKSDPLSDAKGTGTEGGGAEEVVCTDSTSQQAAAGSSSPTKNKPFKIQVCIYSLAKQLSNTNKPYLCSACDKTFSDRSNLIQHLRVHTKEKPYACTEPGCGKRFAHSASLKEHMNIHTGTKPYVCDVPGCGKSFTQASNLRRHQRVHTGEKPFVCPDPDCGKGFAQNINLKQHVKRTHPNLVHLFQKKTKTSADVRASSKTSGSGSGNGNGNGNANANANANGRKRMNGGGGATTSTSSSKIQIF